MRSIVALAIAVSLMGCGSEAASTPAADEDEAAIERTLQEFWTAFADADGERACGLVTEEAAAEMAERAGEASCPEAIEANAGKMLDGQREALRGVKLDSVEVSGDTAEVQMGLEDETFARASGQPLGFARDGDRWLLAEFPPEQAGGQSAGGRGTALDCRTGALASYEEGRAAPFWDNESRADYIAFIRRVCDRVAREVDDLDGPAGRKQAERIANQVIRQMVRSGRIDIE